MSPPRLILASASPSRRTLLTNAGLDPVVQPTDVDEDAIKCRHLSAGTPIEQLAMILATAKGERGCDAAVPYDIILAADQILVCDGRLFDKPKDIGEARDHLTALRGRSHTLVSATVLMRNKAVIWSHEDRAVLVMRQFSDAFLDDYVSHSGSTILSSVGAYRLEDRGSQLFESIDGGYFTILGLPLIPVLTALRSFGALPK